MAERRTALKEILAELEAEMRRRNLWEGSPPPPEAFDSATPFFADTMDFSQWLQWVFIARFRALLGGGHALPAVCDISPMAEEALRDLEADTDAILRLLARFDAYFDSVTPRGE